ncbi:MAG: hypothetical protein MZV70_21935 [Desulfobacterales bacterium]|nr:hypothetical protein [Desulfobacterales bacterium]
MYRSVSCTRSSTIPAFRSGIEIAAEQGRAGPGGAQRQRSVYAELVQRLRQRPHHRPRRPLLFGLRSPGRRLQIGGQSEWRPAKSSPRPGTPGPMGAPGLYFELRHHDRPLDPMEWLKRG